MYEVISELKLVRPSLFGYDWGASIALRLAIQKGPTSFTKVIAFMPAYGENEENKDELKRLKVPTMV